MRDEEEVARLLRISFMESGTDTLTHSELVRFWALDMQWFSPEVSEEVSDALLRGGWLHERKGLMSPALTSIDIDIPLGWRPIARRMIQIGPMVVIPEVIESEDSGDSDAAEEVGESTSGDSMDVSEGHGDPIASQNFPTDERANPPLSISPTELAERPTDPWIDRIPSLLHLISDSSGLESKEVMRRAQRKRRALGPVTLWMSLMLVAREQRIDIEPFLEM